MKGKLVIFLTVVLAGTATAGGSQQSDDMMFSAPPNRQSLGGGADNVGRAGPLTLELNDQMVEELRRSGAMQAPIQPSDVPNVNQIVFGYSNPIDRLEQERNFGLIEPVSKSKGVLVFEFRESDIHKIQNSTLRYLITAEEMGRYEAVEIVYRGATRDHSNADRNQPIENPSSGSGLSFDTSSRSQGNDRVINPPVDAGLFGGFDQRGSTDRQRGDFSQPPTRVDRDNLEPLRREDRPDGGRVDNQSGNRTSNSPMGRDINLPGFNLGRNENGSGGQGRGSRDSVDGRSAAGNQELDALQRKLETIDRLSRDLLEDKRELEREKARFAEAKNDWLRDRDPSNNRDSSVNSLLGSQFPADRYDETLSVLQSRIDSIERQNRRLKTENHDLLNYLDRLESDVTSNGRHGSSFADRWANRVEPKPTSPSRLEGMQASLPGTNQMTDPRDANREVRAKRDVGVLYSLLIGSLALNLYLAWISRGFYVRYSELADELRETFASSV